MYISDIHMCVYVICVYVYMCVIPDDFVCVPKDTWTDTEGRVPEMDRGSRHTPMTSSERSSRYWSLPVLKDLFIGRRVERYPLEIPYKS